MTAQEWRRAKEIFSTAIALAESERGLFIEVQPDPQAVLDEVRSLLITYQQSPDFLEGAAPELPPAMLADGPAVPLAGRRIGAWQLIREIGQGGMGVVWEARRADDQYDQRAAVKLLHASLLSDRDVRRFVDERQILASLNHPGIARLLDGGMLADGAPYLVMEFVDGLPLDAWCDSKNLSIRQRLETFLLVCSAVEYAHRQLVIHRDLKPANILVTDDGVPKLLDFGIAKLMQMDRGPQRSTTRLLTPDCASPEQVRGDLLSTANDVFSLGVLLYVLLTGHHPFTVANANPLQTLRAICELDPRPPSSVEPSRRRELAGEMDAIILQALRKNPAERYPSVHAFAEDVRAWLSGAPVSAIRQSWWRRSVKLIRRYKVQSAAIAVAIASLLTGMVVTSIEAKYARQSEQEAVVQKDHAQIAQRTAQAERDRAIAAQQAAIAAERAAAEDRNRANTEATTALSINDFLEKDLLAQASPSNQNSENGNPDPDLKVRTALDRAAERIPGKFAGQPLVEASIRQTIGESYIGLDLFQQAQPQLERVVELQKKALGEDAPETLRSMESLAMIYKYRSQYSQAEAIYRHVLQTRRKTLGADHPDTLTAAAEYGFFEVFMGRYSEAESMLRQVVDTRRRLYPGQTEEFLWAVNCLADVYLAEGKYAETESAAREGLTIARRLHGEEHPDAIRFLTTLERTYRATNRLEDAEKIATQLVSSFRRLYGAEHPDTVLFESDLAGIYRLEGRFTESAALLAQVLEIGRRANGSEDAYTLAYECYYIAALDSLGRFDEAERYAKNNLETYRRVHGEEFRGTIASEMVFAAHERALGRYSVAEPILIKHLATVQKLRGAEHPDVASAMTLLGVLYQNEGKTDLAESTLTNALALDRKLPTGNLTLRVCLTAMARLRLTQRKYAEAESLLHEAMNGAGNQNTQAWDTLDRQSLLGASLLGQGRYAEAEPLLIAGYQGLLKQSPAISVDANLPQAGERLVQLYSAWGRPEKADEWRRQLQAVTK